MPVAERSATQIASALHALSGQIDGDVLAEELERKLYSSDASVYQELPMAVIRPRHADDLQKIVAWSAQHKLPIIPRAGGTSLAGQVVGNGVIVDVSRYMHQYGEYNIQDHWIELEVGIIQDDLNDRVAADGLTFGPDTSTSNRCMIGGMIGNNACGEHSIIHGTTREHARAMSVILSDGSRARFGPVTAEELEQKKALNNLEGKIYREVYDLIDKNLQLIDERFPKKNIIRRNTGYALDALAQSQPWNKDGPLFNLSPLICGSEGTLCMVSSARLNLEPLPKRKIVVCLHCETVVEACRATIIALKHKPSAVELMDDNILEATKGNLLQQRNRFWVQGDPGAVLPIEFYGDNDEELEQRCEALIADLKKAGLGYAFPILKHEQARHVWDLRRAGLGLLMGIPGDKKSLPLLEDAAVAVEDLPAYVEGVQKIMKRHDLNIVYYAHASVGLLHIRPQIDIKQDSQVKLFEQIGHEVFELVESFGGSISGEHGDGRLRAPFIQKVFGDECYALFRQVKQIFDPDNIFNPHKIVDPLPMTSDLRFVKDYQTPEVDTFFDWSADQGLVRATEKCNGAGACRKSPGRGTMCPSYHATLEEKHSTRGRANIFRQALKAEDPREAFSSKELEEVLDLCLSCKACKSECPANVDMGRLKAEFFQQKYQTQRPPMRSKMFAQFSKQARLASRLPRWVQGMFNRSLVKKIIGMHPQRSMPPFSKLRFADWIKGHAPQQASSGPEVLLFVDEFSQYLDAEMVRDAVLLLERLGFTVRSLWDIDSGRASLSKGFVKDARTYD